MEAGTEQLDIGAAGYRAPQDAHRPVSRIGESDQLRRHELVIRRGPGAAGPRERSPRNILTGFARGSPKVTISAVSAFSAAGCRPCRFVAEAPRTTLTELHPVSGKVTSCMLLFFFSIACLAASAVI